MRPAPIFGFPLLMRKASAAATRGSPWPMLSTSVGIDTNGDGQGDDHPIDANDQGALDHGACGHVPETPTAARWPASVTISGKVEGRASLQAAADSWTRRLTPGCGPLRRRRGGPPGMGVG